MYPKNLLFSNLFIGGTGLASLHLKILLHVLFIQGTRLLERVAFVLGDQEVRAQAQSTVKI